MDTHYGSFGEAYEIFIMVVMVIDNMRLNKGMLPNYFSSIIYAPAASVLEVTKKPDSIQLKIHVCNINNCFP